MKRKLLFSFVIFCLLGMLNVRAQDMTDSIVNPSFEIGDNSGWTVTGADGYAWVGPNTDGDATKDGSYINGVWNGSIGDVEWSQTVSLPNGFYKVSGDFTVNNGSKGNRLSTQRLFAGNMSVLYAKESDYPAANIDSLELTEIVSFGNHDLSPAQNGPFKTLSVLVEVTSGSLTIGARTNGNSSATAFDFSYASGDAGFFKFDNFRIFKADTLSLDSIGLSVGALDSVFDPGVYEYTATLPMGTKSVTPIAYVLSDSIKVTGDETVDVSGKSGTSVIEVTRLDGKVITYTINYTVPSLLDELTDSIVNPSFEMGDNTGWTLTGAAGYKWATPSGDGDATKDGDFINGVWNNPIGDVEWSQTVSLPNGAYKITGDFTVNSGSKGNRLSTQRLFAGDKSMLYASESEYPAANIDSLERTETVSFGDYALSPGEKGPFNTLSVLVEVTDGTLTLGARTNGQASATDFDLAYAAADAGFFKFDNFRIYSLSKATLDNITLSVGSLDTEFDPEVLDYTATLPFGTDTVVPSVVITYAGITVTGDTTIDVSGGSGTSAIEVTTLDGSKYTYTINYKLNVLPDPIAWWKFDETSGDVVSDEEGSSDGTLVNGGDSLWTAGLENNAIDFGKGSDSAYVEVPDNTIIDFDSLTSFSASVLVKVSDISSSEDMNIFFKGAMGKNTPDEKGKWYGLNFKNNELRFAVDDDVVKSQLAYTDANLSLNMDGWNHIVAVRDVEKDSMYLYINGEMVASMPDGTDMSIISTPLPLVIGNNPDHKRNFDGAIDELIMYSDALNGSQIKDLAGSYGLAREPSSDNTLADIMIDGVSLDGFADSVTTYDVVLPYGTKNAPVVTATVHSKYASYVVENAIGLPGSAIVTVTAEDGTTQEYTVKFTVSKISDIADLSAITLSPTADLTPAFDKDVTDYSAVLPIGTTSVIVSVTRVDPNASVTGAGTIDVSSGSGTATIVVTSPDGKVTKTYTVDFTVEKPNALDEVSSSISAYYIRQTGELVINDISGLRAIEIYDITGKLIGSVQENSITERVNIDRFNQSSSYFNLIRLIATDSNESVTIKAIR